MLRLFRQILVSVIAGCIVALLTLDGRDRTELALLVGLTAAVVMLLITELALRTPLAVTANRHRLLAWLDGLRGRHGPLDEDEQSQLSALERERSGYVQRRLRDRVREVDRQIRKAKRQR